MNRDERQAAVYEWVYVDPFAGTLFGKEEDDAVLKHGRARVYGLEAPRD